MPETTAHWQDLKKHTSTQKCKLRLKEFQRRDETKHTFRISVKPNLFSIRVVFSESRMAKEKMRWKFWQGRSVHITCCSKETAQHSP